MNDIDRDDLEMYLCWHREKVLTFVARHQQVIRRVTSLLLDGRLISLSSGAAQDDAEGLVGHYVDAEAEALALAYQAKCRLPSKSLTDLGQIAIAHTRDLVDVCCEKRHTPPIYGIVALALYADQKHDHLQYGPLGAGAEQGRVWMKMHEAGTH